MNPLDIFPKAIAGMLFMTALAASRDNAPQSLQQGQTIPAGTNVAPAKAAHTVQPASATRPALRVGNKAPDITVAKWLKGQPVPHFEDGKVYVVEFWATWCGPCKQAMPHLSEMAKKYKGKATFIGVDIWEKPAPDVNKVEAFVKEMGDKMDYNVAMEGKDDAMGQNWMTAAGENGIPTSFVINQEGKIAWIGHPMAGLDEVVGKVIDKSYSSQAGAADSAKRQAAMAAYRALMKPLSDALQANDANKALEAIDSISKQDPERASSLVPIKFQMLAQRDGDAAAYAYARDVQNDTSPDVKMAPKDNHAWLRYVLAFQIMDDKVKLKNRDYAFAAQLAQEAVDTDPQHISGFVCTLAMAVYKSGDKVKGGEIAEKAIKLIRADDHMPDSMKTTQIAELSKLLPGN